MSEGYFISTGSLDLVEPVKLCRSRFIAPGTEFTTVRGLTTDHAPFGAHGPLMSDVELMGWDSRDNQQAAGVLIKGLKWK